MDECTGLYFLSDHPSRTCAIDSNAEAFESAKSYCSLVDDPVGKDYVYEGMLVLEFGDQSYWLEVYTGHAVLLEPDPSHKLPPQPIGKFPFHGRSLEYVLFSSPSDVLDGLNEEDGESEDGVGSLGGVGD